MRKILIILTVLALRVTAQDLPEHNPHLYVTDLADILTDAQERDIDSRIREYKALTSTEFAVVTVPTLQGADVADYGNKLYKKWKLGTPEYNNGMLFLTCPTERKWRIEVGYGLEPFLTDSYTKDKALSLLKPNFKQKKYYEGIVALIDDFKAKIGNEPFGTMLAGYKKSQAEIAEAKAIQDKKDAEASAEAEANFVIGLLWFLGISSIIVLTVIVVRYERRKKEKAEQERLRLEREAKAHKELIASLQQQVKSLKKYRETTEKRVAAIEAFPYNIGQDTLRKVFDTDCDEIAREVVEISEFETELRDTIARLTKITKESDHAIREFEIQMSNISKIVHDANNLPKSISALKTQQKDAMDKFTSISRRYPTGVWTGRMSEPNIDSLLLSATAISETVVSLIKDNKMAQAEAKITAGKELLTKANTYIRSPFELEEQIKQAESVISKSDSTVSNLKSKGDRLYVNTDVEASSKRKFTEACKLQASKTGNVIQDAIASANVANALTTAINTMQRDIDDAETKRRRKREEEERRERRRREEEEESSRRSSYSSASSCSSSSSSSSSCSSSSFSGGDSGGGGSSGDW